MKKIITAGLTGVLLLSMLTGCTSNTLIKSYEDTAFNNKSLIINIDEDSHSNFFAEDLVIFPKTSSIQNETSESNKSEKETESETEKTKETEKKNETESNKDEDADKEDPAEKETSNEDTVENKDNIESKAALLAGIDTRKNVYDKNIYERLYPASTTKIMTALLTLENADFSEVVTFTEDMTVNESGAKLCGFNVGDQITVEQLFYAMLIYSGNDAANALAVHIGGSIEGFAEMMNARAKTLGCVDTHFLNPSGLHEDDHYTSAYDLYLIFNECIKHDQFEQAIRQSSYDLTYKNASNGSEFLHLDTTNQYFLDAYDYPEHVKVIGGKTGTTDQAGSCIILYIKSIATDQGYISVILGANDSSELYTEMNLLLDKIPK